MNICPSKEIQFNFFEKNCMLFSNEDENKMCYMEIFNEYTKLIEEFIVGNLSIMSHTIDMNSFLYELR